MQNILVENLNFYKFIQQMLKVLDVILWPAIAIVVSGFVSCLVLGMRGGGSNVSYITHKTTIILDAVKELESPQITGKSYAPRIGFKEFIAFDIKGGKRGKGGL